MNVDFISSEDYNVQLNNGNEFEVQADSVQTIDVEFQTENFVCSFEPDGQMNVKFEGVEYGGPYEVIPSNQEQTLQTEKLLMTQDVTIRPIPSNYGLITWDGSTLTVS